MPARAGAVPRQCGGTEPQQAWIVFGGGADMAWQRLLRPGFRHCFAALADAHQYACSERNLQFARELERVKPSLRNFVWCAAVALEVVAQCLDHHSL